MRASGRFETTLVNEADMPAFKRRVGVPADLASCHTAVVQNYVIEGHVPADDIARLLAERPVGVIGLAVPGMPVGSPGMEALDERRDPFDVHVFKADGSRTVFTHHPGA